MKITDKGYGEFELVPETKSLEDIAVAVILASYGSAIPIGLGLYRSHGTELTRKMAERMIDGEDVSNDYPSNINKPNVVNMDYVFGRCCKTYITIKPIENKVKVMISERDRRPKEIIKRANEILMKG